MVQAGMTAVVTRALSWCARGRCKRQWRLSRAGDWLWQWRPTAAGAVEAQVAQSFARGGGNMK